MTILYIILAAYFGIGLGVAFCIIAVSKAFGDECSVAEYLGMFILLFLFWPFIIGYNMLKN